MPLKKFSEPIIYCLSQDVLVDRKLEENGMTTTLRGKTAMHWLNNIQKKALFHGRALKQFRTLTVLGINYLLPSPIYRTLTILTMHVTAKRWSAKTATLHTICKVFQEVAFYTHSCS